MKASTITKLKIYYRLTKPGIIYGNLLMVAGGFFFGSKAQLIWQPFLGIMVGSALVMACGCVLNNYIDRELDKKMVRTSKRAIPTGVIPVKSAIIFAWLLGLAGISLLAVYTNRLALISGVFGLFFYVVVYGWAKRKSVHGTVVGSVSGAIPPLAGYLAATNRLDMGALLVFAALTAWQMPHFYSIAIYRYKDYKAAGLPVLPVKKGMRATKLQILAYILLFIGIMIALNLSGYTGTVFLAVMLAVSLYWLWLGIKDVGADDNKTWGRKMFSFSLVVLLSLSLSLSINSWFM